MVFGCLLHSFELRFYYLRLVTVHDETSKHTLRFDRQGKRWKHVFLKSFSVMQAQKSKAEFKLGFLMNKI